MLLTASELCTVAVQFIVKCLPMFLAHVLTMFNDYEVWYIGFVFSFYVIYLQGKCFCLVRRMGIVIAVLIVI